MSGDELSVEKAWMPDGEGLPEVVREILEQAGGTVHLRLVDGTGAYPRGGCDRGLGQWWSGKASEVNCLACLELVHA